MKNIFVLAFITFLSTAVIAQNIKPEIKAGTSVGLDMQYHGQSLTLDLTIKTITADVISIDWGVAGTTGTFAMKAKALESGSKFGGDQPTPDAVTALSDEETFMCISKATYQTMVKTKSFVYSGLTYTVKDNADGFKIGGKPADATYATTADGKTTLWILNNAGYPLTLAMTGNPIGIDYKVTDLR